MNPCTSISLLVDVQSMGGTGTCSKHTMASVMRCLYIFVNPASGGHAELPGGLLGVLMEDLLASNLQINWSLAGKNCWCKICE